MTQDQALSLLAKHGKLIKRPFVLAAGLPAGLPAGLSSGLAAELALVGFDEEAWAAALKRVEL